MIIGIVAIAKDLAIGKDGKLPWRYSSDLKFFKRSTVGNTVVMGANTWRAIGKPLPDRLNIVLSRSGDIVLPPEVLHFRHLAQVLELARYIRGDIYIIGGSGVYNSFAEHIDKWLVTDIPVEVPGADTFMPADFLNAFFEVDREILDDGLVVRKLSREGKTGV
jgi:dihydrofolate reductase